MTGSAHPKKMNESLHGYWTKESMDCPGGKDIMFIDETRMRIIVAMTYLLDGIQRRVTIRVWFEYLSSQQFRTRVIFQRDDWLVTDFRIEEKKLFLVTNQWESIYDRLPDDAHPDWLEETLIQANLKMDQKEQERQKSTPRPIDPESQR